MSLKSYTCTQPYTHVHTHTLIYNKHLVRRSIAKFGRRQEDRVAGSIFDRSNVGLPELLREADKSPLTINALPDRMHGFANSPPGGGRPPIPTSPAPSVRPISAPAMAVPLSVSQQFHNAGEHVGLGAGQGEEPNDVSFCYSSLLLVVSF